MPSRSHARGGAPRGPSCSRKDGPAPLPCSSQSAEETWPPPTHLWRLQKESGRGPVQEGGAGGWKAECLTCGDGAPSAHRRPGCAHPALSTTGTVHPGPGDSASKRHGGPGTGNGHFSLQCLSSHGHPGETGLCFLRRGHMAPTREHPAVLKHTSDSSALRDSGAQPALLPTHAYSGPAQSGHRGLGVSLHRGT